MSTHLECERRLKICYIWYFLCIRGRKYVQVWLCSRVCVRRSVLTGFTFEFSLAVAQAGAAHHVAVLSVAIPLLADAVVVAVVVTPL